jgi:hypothetical protein
MKHKKILFFTLVAVILTGCGPDFSSIPRGVKDKLDIKILKLADEESDVPKNFSILCIDGVKYLMTDKGGITVKFQANENSDPSAEECE